MYLQKPSDLVIDIIDKCIKLDRLFDTICVWLLDGDTRIKLNNHL